MTPSKKSTTSRSKTTAKKQVAQEQPVVIEQPPVKTYKKAFYIAAAVAAVVILVLLYVMFIRPKPVIVRSSSNVELQKAYDDLLTVSEERRAKDSVDKIAFKKNEIYWHNIAVDQQNKLLSNLKLYIENEKKYRAISSNVKPIHDLDSLRAAIKPKY